MTRKEKWDWVIAIVLGLILAVMLLGLLYVSFWAAMEARADTTECKTGEITYTNGTPILKDHAPEIRTGMYWAIVGDFLLVYVGDDSPQNWDADATSYEIPPGATAVSMCMDGTVGFAAASVARYKDTTTTTVEETTTTWEDTTTTSTIPEATTSEVQSSTTTSTVVSTTSSTGSSVPQTSSTTTIMDPASTTTAPTSSSTLPLTGLRSAGLLLSAVAILMGLGTILILTAEKMRKDRE